MVPKGAHELHNPEDDCYKKKVENKTIREDMEKLEPSCVASGNIT